MNQTTSSFFFRCDTSPHLTNFVQFCLQSLCPNHHRNECNECDMDNESKIISLLHELTGVDGNNASNVNQPNFTSFIDTTLQSYSSEDRLYFTKSLSMVIQHTHIQSFASQITIQLLSQIIRSNSNWCARLSDDVSLINFIIKHTIESDNNHMSYEYELLLQFISTNIVIRKTPQIKQLISAFIQCIVCENNHKSEEQNLPKLVILYNILKSKNGLSMQHFMKSLPNLKKFYKRLSRLMGSKNMWTVLYSLFILTKLVINDSVQSQLFNKNNINIVFQLVFNLISHGASTDIKMLQISVDLLSSMLSNEAMFEFLANYPKLHKKIEKFLPLLLSFKAQTKHCSHSLLILQFLYALMGSNKVQSIVINALNTHNYISVILKLCVYHTNTDFFSDFNISIFAVKLITAVIKSRHFDENLSAIFTADTHKCPHFPDTNQSFSSSSNTSHSSIHLSQSQSHESEQFLSDLRTLCFVEDARNVLFGHTQINGNNIVKKLCFAGHIRDYSLLTQSQKYIMHFIQFVNMLCTDRHSEFKNSFVAGIDIQDLSFFLCPSKHNSVNGEPNQIFLSIINLICSFSDDIVGISYLLKTSLCSSALICAILNSLNSKSNSKDISNAITFINHIFKILSKPDRYDGNNTFISNLFLNHSHSENEQKRKRRKKNKKKPRQYERGGLTLSNVGNKNKNNKNECDDDEDNATVASNETMNSNDMNVQNMSPKILYQLFCKKILRFNKTYKTNHSQIALQAKQFESLKLKYAKSVKAMEQTLQSKEAEIEDLKYELERVKRECSAKTTEFVSLRQEFENLKCDYMQIADDNQTKNHIIQDKSEKLNGMKVECDRALEQHRRNENELKHSIDEIMSKLKCVCEGYTALKQESIHRITALESRNTENMARMQTSFDTIESDLRNARSNVLKLSKELKESERHSHELSNNLDNTIRRNSDLNKHCQESDKEIVALKQKLSETQKLAAMIQNLIPH